MATGAICKVSWYEAKLMYAVATSSNCGIRSKAAEFVPLETCERQHPMMTLLTLTVQKSDAKRGTDVKI
jgi:hypothetical protein